MGIKSFDLNIEKILENWEVRHAIREVIANALDEQTLTETAPVAIEKRNAKWVIRDYGRGIRYTHLTQNENQEKLDSPNVIGRFGIGLKDALATFERHNVRAIIRSRFGTIYTNKSAKHGFGDIQTLHAIIEDPADPSFVGTEFELEGVNDQEVDAAKSLFLKFTSAELLDSTRFGQIISRQAGPGAIYINGVKVAEEVNFLFSYNITMLNAAIKKAINRERTHVGRTAYSDSVKKILLASTNSEVASRLSADISRFQEGTMHDELAWIDVQEHAVRILNAQGMVMMVTADEAMSFPDLIDQARERGMTILTIPENLRTKIADSVDIEGNQMVDLTQFTKTYNESFSFDFVEPGMLSLKEMNVFDEIQFVIDIFGGLPRNVKSVRISNSMQPDLMSGSQTLGCWDSTTSSIVIWREQLRSVPAMAGVLIHEMVHAKTGYSDVTRSFEIALTEVIGHLCNGWHRAEKSKEEVIARSVIREEYSEVPNTITIAQRPLEDKACSEVIPASIMMLKNDNDLTEQIQKQAIELKDALKTIISLRTDVEAEKMRTTEVTREFYALQGDMTLLRAEQSNASTVMQPVQSLILTEPTPELAIRPEPDVSSAETSRHQLTTQLDGALKTIARLRTDVEFEKNRSTLVTEKLHALQMDMAKFRAMQSRGSTARAPVNSRKKPWFQFW